MGVQGIELRLDQRAGLLEMRDGGSAIALAVLQHGEHRVRRPIVGTQAQDPIEQRHGGRLPAS